LDELDVAPVDPVEPQRVVVAPPGHLRHPAVPRGELVPLLARDLTRLAPDADGRVGEESHRFGHGGSSFQDSGFRIRDSASALPNPESRIPNPHSFSTLHTNAFPSCIDTLGSPSHAVRSLTTSPTERPSQPQCQGMATWWM